MIRQRQRNPTYGIQPHAFILNMVYNSYELFYCLILLDHDKIDLQSYKTVEKYLTTIIFEVNIFELTKIWVLIDIENFYGPGRARITKRYNYQQ